MSKWVLLIAFLIFFPVILRADAPNESAFPETDPSDIDFLYPTCVAAVHLDAAGVPYRVLVVALKSRHYEASCLFKVGKSTYSYGKGGSRVYLRSFQTNPSPQTWSLPRNQVLQLARDHDSFPDGCLVQATAAYYRRKNDPQIVWAGLINTAISAGPEFVNDGFGLNIIQHTAQGHSIDAFETVNREIYVEENGNSPVKIKAGSSFQEWHDANRLARVLHKNDECQSSFVDEFKR